MAPTNRKEPRPCLSSSPSPRAAHHELTELGHWGLALANVAVCAVVGVGAVALGQALGRAA